MAKDPAFLFYPGDYLRDTQMLSETVQVSYDRIMCEHMRNICVSKQQLKFLTKRLSEDEKEELLSVLTKVGGGYQIAWVAESIVKRRAYSDSRRKNREGKANNISKSYVNHMENENENGINNVISIKEVKKYFKFQGSPEFADDFFNHFNAQDWLTGTGRPITNWQSKANTWIKKELNKPKENKYDKIQRGTIDVDKYKRELATIKPRRA